MGSAARSQVSVMATCGMIAFFMSNLPIYNDPIHHPELYLTSALFPIILSLLIGYVVADIFFSVCAPSLQPSCQPHFLQWPLASLQLA